MCPKCKKLHAIGAACDSARDVSAILSDIERGVGETRDGLKSVDAKVAAYEQRLKDIEEKSKKRSLGLTQDEKDKFSFRKLFLAMSTKDFSCAPFEMDVIKENAKKRDLTTDVDSAGGYLVPNEFMQDLIELLRAKLVTGQLGITRWNGLSAGAVFVPKQTGAATGYWVGEDSQITSSQQTFGQLELRPRKCGALTILSNELLRMSSPAAETSVRNDLAAVLDRLIDLAVLQGVGGTQPLGILNTSGITTRSIAAIPTADDLYNMIYDVEKNNADGGNLAWCFNPRTWNTLRQLKDGNGNYILTTSPTPGNVVSTARVSSGTLLGYPFVTTTAVPITLGATTDRSRIYFGNWSDVVLGEWDGLQFAASNETNRAFEYDQTYIRALARVDVLLKHGESFCVDSTIKA